MTLLQSGDPRCSGAALRILAACIAAALVTPFANAGEADGAIQPSPNGTTLFVTTCDDSGPGSLRATLAAAASRDTVSLSQLSCSTLTLTTGELATSLDDITLAGQVTLSAEGASRIISHTGAGVLTIEGLVLADGSVSGVNPARGGCIYSIGDIYLVGATVRNCSVAAISGTTTAAMGGGAFTLGRAWILNSRIIDNAVADTPSVYSYGRGGGIYAMNDLHLRNSTISGNAAAGTGGYVQGGGFSTRGEAFIEYSTISGNSAYFAGAGVFGRNGVSSIVNSTISGNEGSFRTGGIASFDRLVDVWHSTIVFNTATHPTGGYVEGAGVLMLADNAYLSVRSSIIANNSAAGVSDDVCMNDFGDGIIGSANLILSANMPIPDDTLQADPMLGPLADNGGTTLTHTLLQGSPAIDAGNDLELYPYDQRGMGYARVSASRADIGAFEVQQPSSNETIFADGFD